ncbi:hypothetical protein TKK_0004890 [Trichogramma kaykai]
MAENGENIVPRVLAQEQEVVLGAAANVPLPVPAAPVAARARVRAAPGAVGRGRGQIEPTPRLPGQPPVRSEDLPLNPAQQVLQNARVLPFDRDRSNEAVDRSVHRYQSKRITRSMSGTSSLPTLSAFGDHTIKTACVYREIHKDHWPEHMPGVPFFTHGRQAVIRGDRRFRYAAADHNYVLEAIPNLSQPNGGVLPGPAIATPIGGYYPHQHLVLRHDVYFPRTVSVDSVGIDAFHDYMRNNTINEKSFGERINSQININVNACKALAGLLPLALDRFDNTGLYTKAILYALLNARVQQEAIPVIYPDLGDAGPIQQIDLNNAQFNNLADAISAAILAGRFILIEGYDFDSHNIDIVS